VAFLACRKVLRASTFSSCAVLRLGSVGMPSLRASLRFVPAFLSSSRLKPFPMRCFPSFLTIFAVILVVMCCGLLLRLFASLV